MYRHMCICGGGVDGQTDRRMDIQRKHKNNHSQSKPALPSVLLSGAIPKNALECPHTRLTLTGQLTDTRVLLVNNLLQK